MVVIQVLTRKTLYYCRRSLVLELQTTRELLASSLKKVQDLELESGKVPALQSRIHELERNLGKSNNNTRYVHMYVFTAQQPPNGICSICSGPSESLGQGGQSPTPIFGQEKKPNLLLQMVLDHNLQLHPSLVFRSSYGPVILQLL